MRKQSRIYIKKETKLNRKPGQRNKTKNKEKPDSYR